jgi:hypothetical protein
MAQERAEYPDRNARPQSQPRPDADEQRRQEIRDEIRRRAQYEEPERWDGLS